MTSVPGCPFCKPNWPNLWTPYRNEDTAVIVPLNPVTDGHVLVVHRDHTADAAADPDVTAEVMRTAAWWVRWNDIQANIITSIGPDATQTVFHTHIHVVPRRQGDGLTLPWTGQRVDQ